MEELKIIVNEIHYRKKEGTKTVWVEEETLSDTYTEEQYKNFTEAAPTLRRLGASVKCTYRYTTAGYRVIKDVNTSPSKNEKVVTEFSFEYITKENN